MTDHTPNYPPIQDTTEEWRDIPGYEGYYQISSLGRVKSLFRYKRTGAPVKERILKQRVDRGGYLIVNLRINGVVKTFNTHRLVAIVFLPPIDGMPEVNHKDGCRINNRIENLYWVSHRGNALHALATGLIGHGGRKGTLTPPKVKQIRAYLRFGLSQDKIAALFGVSQATISNIHRGKTWSNVA